MTSIAARQRHRAKTIGKQWSGFVQVPITDKMRNEYPYLKNCFAIYQNTRYSVHLFPQASPAGAFMQCDITRHCSNEEIPWADLNRIKAELFSPDAVALEVYPAYAIALNTERNIRILFVAPTDYELVFGTHLDTAWGNNG